MFPKEGYQSYEPHGVILTFLSERQGFTVADLA